MIIQETNVSEHEITVLGRKELKISGVLDVDSFDEFGAVMRTHMGELTVEGEGLKMEILDTEQGIVTLCGKINGLFYSDDKAGTKKKKLFSNIFK